MILPTLLIALAMYWLGKVLWRTTTFVGGSVILPLAAMILAVPGALMVLYYLHYFDDAVWFYWFRAQPLTELSAAGMGFAAGIVPAAIKRRRFVSEAFVTALPESEPVPVPSIAGVKVGSVGHFIPIMSSVEGTYITGDPLVGREQWDAASLRRHYKFTGFFMKIKTNALQGLANP